MTTNDPRPALRLPPAPPQRPTEGGALLLALPALGGVGSVALVASSGLAGSGAMRTRSLLAAGLFLIVTVAFVVLQVERQRRQRRLQTGMSREDLLLHLERARGQVIAAATAQRAHALARHPEPSALAASPAMPETEGHCIRLGIATGPLGLRLDVADPTPGQPPDVASQRALERFVAAHTEITQLPVELDLDVVGEIAVDGPRDEARAVARAWVCSAARQDPERLQIALLTDNETGRAAWDWLKWLPHHGSATERDAVGPIRMVAAHADDLRAHVSAARLLVIDERHERAADAPPGSSAVLRIGPPRSATSTVVTTDAAAHTARVVRDGADVTPPGFLPDSCDMATATAYARRRSASAHRATEDGLAALLSASPRAPLRVPIGTDPSGVPVQLDLREPAAGGHGPHGLVIGATGSGKSELLRTLVTGLAMTHSPEELNLVLIDFKGGATFAGLAGLPHTSALITNLADDLMLVDRMRDALSGELVRRQQVLRDAGDIVRIADLGPDVAALPTLLVVVDEFTELLATRPDLAELFASIGRVGRSLGVHLLLASQRLDEGRLRGLESHLGFRIALRTFSAAESRAVIGTPDAHELPPRPGAGYLSTGPGEQVRFDTVLVSMPRPQRVPSGLVLPFTSAPVEDRAGSTRIDPPLLESVVAESRSRAGSGRTARRIWLPPLREAPSVAALLATVADPGPDRLPVGLIDLPHEQRHAPLLVDLDGSCGHVAIVGAPRSGRTTLLHTLAEALAATAPEQTRFAVVDLGGGLAALDGLPQVSAYVDRSAPDEVRALVRDVATEAARRRRQRSTEPDLFVVVDGWTTLRERWPDVEAELVALAQESLSVGIHLALTATRWADLRHVLRDVVGTRLELRLGDPMESEHGRLKAQAVPRSPGHGLTPDGHHFLAAVPAGAISDGRRP